MLRKIGTPALTRADILLANTALSLMPGFASSSSLSLENLSFSLSWAAALDPVAVVFGLALISVARMPRSLKLRLAWAGSVASISTRNYLPRGLMQVATKAGMV